MNILDYARDPLMFPPIFKKNVFRANKEHNVFILSSFDVLVIYLSSKNRGPL